MWKAATLVASVLAGAAAVQAQPAEGGAQDDLAVVKRAVEKDEDTRPREEVAARRGDRPRWFRVRIEDRKGARVKVNVPLSLVRDLGDVQKDIEEEWGFCGRRRCRFRLREVLDQLDAGQDLVEIKDSEATVRVWVD